MLTAIPAQTTYNITIEDTFTPPVVSWADNGNTGVISPAGSVDDDTVGAYTLTYDYTDGINAAETLTITVNVSLPIQDDDAQDAIAEVDFELVTPSHLYAYIGRGNIEIMKFKTQAHEHITLTEDGYFDFNDNGVARVEVVANYIDGSRPVLSTFDGTVTLEGAELKYEPGIFTQSGRVPLSVVVYASNDTKGVVIAGIGIQSASPVIDIIE